jgi:hypothetical protein
VANLSRKRSATSILSARGSEIGRIRFRHVLTAWLLQRHRDRGDIVGPLGQHVWKDWLPIQSFAEASMQTAVVWLRLVYEAF